MLFVDASVVVAILAQEPDGTEQMDRLEQDGGPFFMSAIVRMKATLSLARRLAEATGKDKPATPEMFDKACRLVDQLAVHLAARETMISGDLDNKALGAAQR